MINRTMDARYIHILLAMSFFLFIAGLNSEIYGATSFHKVVKKGDRGKVLEAIKSGADINAKDTDGRTPLYIACDKDNTEVVCLLIQNGADVNIRDKKGITPLHLACERGNIEVVKILLQHDANFRAVDNKFKTPFDIATAKNHVEVAKLLEMNSAWETVTKENTIAGYEKFIVIYPNSELASKAREEIKKLKDSIDFTKAINSDSIDVLQSYLTQYPETTRRVDIQNRIEVLQREEKINELIKASESGDILTVKRLISSGLSVNSKNKDGVTPLMAAVSQGHDVSVGMMMDNFHVRGMTVSGLPAPEEKLNNIDVVNFLLSSGASLEENGCKELYLAVERGYIKMAKVLISAGADVNCKVRPKARATIILLAVNYGQLEMVKTLVELGAYCDDSILSADFIEGGNRTGYEEAIQFLQQKLSSK